MKIKSIKRYLKHYKILSRWTTFNGAFQHALAVPDIYNEDEVSKLLKILGQKDSDDLQCIYCPADAMTWDHLHNNVKNSKFSGYGNRIFNLVPACRTCNEKKGGKHWKDFISGKQGEKKIAAKLQKIEKLNTAKIKSWQHIEKKCPDMAKQYESLTGKIRNDLEKLDKIAGKIREKMT